MRFITLELRVDTLKYCHSHNIKVFSSMGAGAQWDRTQIQIAISNTVYNPLAHSVLWRLCLLGVNSGIPMEYSAEVYSSLYLTRSFKRVL
ncbi:hypothetical protein BYT27DRAFT_6338428 [Phlegmacium glaucopus]|nr:hypothetical protein BYT27DRAFT_6338428 [Phlegmacium glaucopus]